MESPRLNNVIQDVDDLADNMDILEEQVKALANPFLTKGDVNVLIDEYIRLEDNILEGIEYWGHNTKSADAQDEIVKLIDTFNNLGCDF